MAIHSNETGDELHRPFRYTQTSDPVSPRSGDVWINPTTGVTKQRNEAGDGWITITDAQSHAPVTVSDSGSIDLTLTGQALSAAAIFGTTAGTVAEGDHTHTAVAAALDDLSDVTAPAPADGDALVWDAMTSQWINQALAAGGATELDGLSDVAVTSPASGQRLVYDGSVWANTAETYTINVVIDGGGAAITTGVKAMLVIDAPGTITAATVLADQTGSMVLDVWKSDYAGAPPTVTNTITASAKPTLSSAQKARDTTLTGWTKTLNAGDVLRVNVDAAATVQRAVLALTVARS